MKDLISSNPSFAMSMEAGSLTYRNIRGLGCFRRFERVEDHLVGFRTLSFPE